MEECSVPIPEDLPAASSRPILPVKHLKQIIAYATARNGQYVFQIEAAACEAIGTGELLVDFTYDGETPTAIVLTDA